MQEVFSEIDKLNSDIVEYVTLKLYKNPKELTGFLQLSIKQKQNMLSVSQKMEDASKKLAELG